MSLQHIHLEGNLFTSDHLARLQTGDKELGGLSATDYGVKRRLDEEISEAYNRLDRAWKRFLGRRKMESSHPKVVTDEWVEEVWRALGGGPLIEDPVAPIEGKVYPIRFQWQGVPIHVVPFEQDLEKGPKGDARGNPHSTLQEYLNRREEAVWGILTNGHSFRILRDDANSTRPAYVEFDLKGMMESQSFAEFGIFWRMCHYTRFLKGQDCWLEKWMHESATRGTPARDLLRGAVENALNTLGRGYLRHPKNKALRQRLQKGALTPNDYYRQLLRLVYRLIFLFVTEDRGLLLDPKASPEAKELYAKYYSTRRLRTLAHTVRGTRHHDLYESVKVVMDGLKDANGKPALALPPLNSDLWSRTFIPDLDPPDGSEKAETGYLENRDLLSAVHDLSRIRMPGGEYRTVDYRNLGSDELGSIYESLLELEAAVDAEGREFKLAVAGGGERKTTGSHYTPQNLIEEVLDHALEPLLDDAEKAHPNDPPGAIKAILDLTVCDPTCGSGHFLIAAAHRMAKRVARIETGDPEPAPGDLRRALRTVIGRCIYGVDINPMSVELCKVSLWLEAMEPGKPLAYLEHHIKCGNALLGVTPHMLERGIPDEAYTPREGLDDGSTCRKLVKLNREFPMNTGTLEGFRSDQRRVTESLSAALSRIEEMPTSTVAQVEAKDAEYRSTFIETDEYDRYKRAMDAWCAAFSYQKGAPQGQEHITNVQLVDFLHPEATVSRETLDLVETEASAEVNRFFHWSLEFPSVFRHGGFDVVIGNPPYLGGGKVSGTLGAHYNSFLAAVYPHYHSKGDIASAFLLRSWGILSSRGQLGLVTTNSISQGHTRENGLREIRRTGGHILAASVNRPWTGDASVVVHVVVVGKEARGSWLNGASVAEINSRLEAAPELDIAPLVENADKSFIGSVPGGTGFIISADEARAWIQHEPRNAEVLFPYLTGEDLFGSPTTEPSRWIICFHDWDEDKAKLYKRPYDRVRDLVLPTRAESNRKSYRDYWWLFMEHSVKLRKELEGTTHVLVRSSVSETPLFIRKPKTMIFSNLLTVVVKASDFDAGVLNSSVHEVWYRRQSSTMKNDVRYTPTECYQTFPFPPNSRRVGELGAKFLREVESISLAMGLGPTRLWNLVNDEACAEKMIVTLRETRDELTRAVVSAYGWAIMPRFGFHRDSAGRLRYTIHPEDAHEIYLLLARLNAERASSVAVALKNPPLKSAKGQTKLTGGQRRLPSE